MFSKIYSRKQNAWVRPLVLRNTTEIGATAGMTCPSGGGPLALSLASRLICVSPWDAR